ncbi:MAG: heat-inducible transcriptional repressor HrcA [Christensenellales bacterium]|jgi:heat-inducible transcriptional repressor
MEMKERKKRILKAIVDDYIHYAQPIGSRSITEKYSLGLSPATIRIEMSGLEEMGYLEQPHVSAGRVPSDKAYRLYVDVLMDSIRLGKEEAELIKKHVSNRAGEIKKIMRGALEALSSATEYIAVALAPHAAASKVKSIRLVPVAAGKALIIVVTDTGMLNDTILNVPEDITEDVLYVVSRHLSEELCGKTLAEAMLLAPEIADFSSDVPAGLIHEFGVAVKETLDKPDNSDILLEGASKIFEFPEYSDVGKAKLLLSALENKKRLYEMFSKASAEDYAAIIGTENEFKEMSGCSVITANFSIKGIKLGSFGIIGPTRMDYARIFAVLDLLGKSIEETAIENVKDE